LTARLENRSPAFAACCARAASGQATAVPPTSAMNSRRLMYQLGLMLILVARLAHFLISAAMNFAKSSGELEAAASSPGALSFARKSESASAPRMAAFSLVTIECGVPFGTTKPFQPMTSKSGRPDWAIAGMPGTNGDGLSEVTPIPRTVSPAICDCAVEAIENIICTAPLTTALTPEFASRYGTCTMSTPAMDLNNSPARCGGVPMPDEA